MFVASEYTRGISAATSAKYLELRLAIGSLCTVEYLGGIIDIYFASLHTSRDDASGVRSIRV